MRQKRAPCQGSRTASHGGSQRGSRIITQIDHKATRAVREAVLEDATTTPPPLTAVARQLGCSARLLRSYFPQLCRAISAQYLADGRQRARRHDEAMLKAVRAAASGLVEQGIYPSRCRVEQALGNPWLLRSARAKDALRAIQVQFITLPRPEAARD